MGKNILKFLFLLCCLFIFPGCQNSNSLNDKTSNQVNNDSILIEDEDKKNVTINTFLKTNISSREKFYLESNNSFSYIPFEVNLDSVYANLVCKLYCYQDSNWKKIQDFSLEINGSNFWILINSDLTNSSVLFHNISSINSKPTVLSGGRVFDAITPEFGFQGTSQYYESIDEVNIKNEEEFAVVASRIAKGVKHLYANPNDFYHPEKVRMEIDEEYYIITLQFVK